MNNNRTSGNPKILADKVPNVIAGTTALFFILSFSYNIIYFILLGINIELVQLTISDYTLSIQLYIIMLIPTAISLSPSIINFYKNFANIQDGLTIRHISKKLQFFLIGIALIFPILPAVSIYNGVMKNIYLIEPLFLCIPIISLLILCLFMKLLSSTKRYLLLLGYLFFITICLIWIAKTNITKSFMNNNYLSNLQHIKIIRTLERGFLVSNNNYELSFIYLDNTNIIHFDRNDKLAEYFEKYIIFNKK